jgi:hypothetical protein
MGIGVLLGQGEQTLIGLPCGSTGIGRKGLFQVNSYIPIWAKFNFGSVKSFLRNKGWIELHIVPVSVK